MKLDIAEPLCYFPHTLFIRIYSADQIDRKEENMRKYESVIIFNTEEGQFEQGREFFKQQLVGAGAQATKEEDMGERSLAYEIKKHDRGHYYFFAFEAMPEKIKTIEKSIKLKTEILKVLFVRKDN